MRRGSGQLESEVLGVLWAADGALTPAEVLAALGTGLAYNTVHTILTRLVEKGALTKVNGHYAPARDAADDSAGRMRAVLDAGADRAAILARFVTALDPDDERVLRALLREPH